MEVRFPKLGKSEIIIFWDVTKRGKSVMYSSGLGNGFGTEYVENYGIKKENSGSVLVMDWFGGVS